MSYENATYINQLDRNLPKGSDSVSEGDIHLRTIKEVLKNSFPNVDTPVNAIHTGDTAPILHSAGTVWFDTASGLVKMRDQEDTVWLVMAHGQANGLGSQLKISYEKWYASNQFNSQTQVLIKDFSVNPLSQTSTFMIEISGFTTGGGSFQMKDATNGGDISPEVGVDSGTLFMREFYTGHSGNPFEVGFWARGTSSTNTILFVATEVE